WNYLLALSQAASDAGLGGFASQLAAEFEKRTKKEPSRNPSSGAGSQAAPNPDLESILAESEKNYIIAKALWIKERNTPSENTLKRIRDLLDQVHEESRYSYGKHLMLALLDER